MTEVEAIETRARIGERLKTFRGRQNLSQRKLGSLLGVSHATISKWETADAPIASELLPQISTLLRCHPCDFFDPPAAPTPGASTEYRPAQGDTIVGGYLRRLAQMQPEELGDLEGMKLDAEESALIMTIVAFLQSRRGR